MKRRAVFLDRDGVLAPDRGLVTSSDQLDVYPWAQESLRRLRGGGFVLVVVSNQPVVARGLATEEDIHRANQRLQELLPDAPIDGFYFCPHHPNATVVQYRVACSCRKPRPGMLFEASVQLDLDIAESFMVGDRPSDVAAGQQAGCRTVLLETGTHLEPPIESPDGLDTSIQPDFRCPDLAAATDVILTVGR